jgi:hypothetical protein
MFLEKLSKKPKAVTCAVCGKTISPREHRRVDKNRVAESGRFEYDRSDMGDDTRTNGVSGGPLSLSDDQVCVSPQCCAKRDHSAYTCTR